MRHTPLLAVTLATLVGAVLHAQSAPSLFADKNYSAGVGRVVDLAFSGDGRLLAAAGASGEVAVWDTQAATLVRRAKMSAEAATRMAFGASSVVAAGTERGGVSVLSLITGDVHEVARHGRNAVTAVALLPDGSSGASGDAAGDILIWQTEGGQPEQLREGSRREPIVFLAFVTPTTLISVSKELAVTTWDVPKRRSVRRGTLQIEALGRSADFYAASVETGGGHLALASQYLARPRGGAIANSGLARPEDLKRTNVIVPYTSDSGVAGDPIALGDFLAERIALSPGACFALFTSNYRDQPRLHIWSLVKQGQDLARQELPNRASALAIDPTGRFVAAGLQNGEMRIWRLSGVSASDCQLYRDAQSPAVQRAGPRIAAGSEATPLFADKTGFKVAVIRFDAGGVEASVGEGVAEMVGGELSNSGRVVVVERSAIDAIVKEMQLQASGLTAADAAKVGRGLNAQKVVLGSVRRFGQTTFVLSARIVDVETQQVEGSREVTCENCTEADLPTAVRALRQAIVP